MAISTIYLLRFCQYLACVYSVFRAYFTISTPTAKTPNQGRLIKMIVIVSPAKKLNLDNEKTPDITKTKPRFENDAKKLAKIGAEKSEGEIADLMHISAKLAEGAANWFATFSSKGATSDAKPAAFMFSGDTYVGLDIRTMDKKSLKRAQDRLLIISGLYGALRPFDIIKPYRMDMGTKLENPKGKNLYQYWGDKVSKAVAAQAKETKSKAVINLASKEYFSVLDREKLGAPVITPVFKEIQDGEIRTLGLFAKRARGAMARWIMENNIKKPEDIKSFDVNGYKFQPGASDETELTFARPQPPSKTAGKAAKTHQKNRH